MAIVQSRYAEGLIDVAIENNLVDRFEQEFDYMVQNVFTEEFYNLMNYPGYSKEIKVQIAQKILKGTVHEYIANFVTVLIKNERINVIEMTVKEYKELANVYRSSKVIEVISAFELDKIQLNEIKEKITQIYNYNNVDIITNIDTNLIGGVMIKIGNTIIDGTIKGKLDLMKSVLI